jgi:CRP-like cAMP-binding protein
MTRLLDGLAEGEQAAVAAALARCPTLMLPAGASRPAARVPESAFLVVEEGIVLVTRARPGVLRRMAVAVAGPGALLLAPTPEERLEALVDTWLTAVSPEARTALLEVPAAAGALVDALSEALLDRQESLGQFASVRHADRVRDKLLQLARAHGKVVPGGVRVDLPLTHELLGEMVGSARETVTWSFAQLRREGFVARDGRGYRLAVAPELLAG